MPKETILFYLSTGGASLLLSFLTAFIYTKAFSISRKTARTILGIGIVFPLLYVLINSLGRASDSGFLNLLYIGVNIGGGFALYFLLGAATLVMLMLIFRIASMSMPVYVPWVVTGLMVLLSVVGVLQARTITIIDHDIPIHDLPSSWDGKQAILFSDSHYGLVNHERASRRLTQLILEENPDMVFIAGDLFDGPSIDTSPLVEEWLKMSHVMPVFYAPGNHEEYGDYDAFITSIRSAGFSVLEDEIFTHDEVKVLGLRYRGKSGSEETAKILENLELSEDVPLIVINHSPLFQSVLEDKGADLMLSGHTHRGQLWPGRYLTKAIYGIYHYGLHPYGNMSVLTTSGVGTVGPPMRLFNPPEIIRITFQPL